MTGEAKKAIEIFYSYAHEDELLRNELEKHLNLLKRQGLISGWHDRLISAGTEWEHEIDKHLNTAQIILLLISPDFMVSEYCYSIEMQRAMERHASGEAKVIPIILRPVYWEGAPIGKLQALPTDTRPIIIWHNQDEAFLDVVRGIRKVIQELSSPIVTSANPPNVLKPIDGVNQGQSIQDSWSIAGALGELVGSLADVQQWGQAEAMARSIGDSRKRSQILRKLVNELTKAEQWERAEAVTMTIEDREYKEKALVELANSLAAMQQWGRAEAVARSIENSYERMRMLSELSRSSARAGEVRRAMSLAYDVAPSLDKRIYDYPPTGAAIPSTRSSPSYVSRRQTGVGCLVVLLLIITLLAVLSPNHLLWGILLGIVLIVVAIIAFFWWLKD